MANLNKVMLIGNLTRDPEVRYTPKGSAVAELGLAINRRYTVGDDRREEVTFVDVTLWGKTAEVAEKYLRKGRPVYIEGRLQLDTWDDKSTGQKRSKLKVVGENIEFLDSRRDDDGGGQGGGSRSGGGGGGYQRSNQDRGESRSNRSNEYDGPDFQPEEEDDIPF